MKPIDEMTPVERAAEDMKFSQPGAVVDVSELTDEQILNLPFPVNSVSNYKYPPTHRQLTLTIDVHDTGDDLLQPYIERVLAIWLARSKMGEVSYVEEIVPASAYRCFPHRLITLNVTHKNLTEGIRDEKESEVQEEVRHVDEKDGVVPRQE